MIVRNKGIKSVKSITDTLLLYIWEVLFLSQASFGHELLGREVVDAVGDSLGILVDLEIDSHSGSVVNMLIKVEENIDSSLLPWSMNRDLLRVPVEVVDRIASKVHLRT